MVTTNTVEPLTAQEFRSLLRKSKPCFAWVNVYLQDGEYVQVNKTHLLELVHPDSTSQFNVQEREDGIYIN